MMSEDAHELPASIKHFIRALKGEIPWADIRPYLASTVIHSIAGRITRGVDGILQMLQRHAGALAGAQWTALPAGGSTHMTIRGETPGKSMPSIGGPMSAMEFSFALNSEGQIAEIFPRPHHLEPPDLRPPLALGAHISAFELQSVEGTIERIDPAQAAALLVVFTCNQCPWALGWHGRLQAVARDYQAHDVCMLQVIANDPTLSPRDSVAASRERLARGEFATALLFDERQRLARAWGARHTPEIFLFQNAALVYHGAPDADFQDKTLAARWLREALDAVLLGRQVSRSSTSPTGCTIKWTLAPVRQGDGG